MVKSCTSNWVPRIKDLEKDLGAWRRWPAPDILANTTPSAMTGPKKKLIGQRDGGDDALPGRRLWR
jgi:hypothetical protein